MASNCIFIAGGGPAGAAAAIAASLEGTPVRLFDRAATFRHKVCGEFISPYSSEILEALGVWDEFRLLAPCGIRRCILHLGRFTKQWDLPERAWGLSRLELDRLLLQKAASCGAIVSRGESFDPSRLDRTGGRVILASGRKPDAEGGDRLFGFKAHFEGPCGDAVELFFQEHGYAGVSGIENGLTNVAGIAPESLLRKHAFDFDEFLLRGGPLADRLRPLRRIMDWIVTGPVSFSSPSTRAAGNGAYPAGDALGFIDPYTGTGILNALLTGRLAGIAASRRIPVPEYLKMCTKLLSGAFRVSSVLRYFTTHTEVHRLARWIPGQLIFRWTRASRSPL